MKEKISLRSSVNQLVNFVIKLDKRRFIFNICADKVNELKDVVNRAYNLSTALPLMIKIFSSFLGVNF